MTISFIDNQDSHRIINLQNITEISYDDGKKYVMFYFGEDTKTVTFSDLETKEKVIKTIRSVMDTVEVEAS